MKSRSEETQRILSALDSVTILVDKREQQTARAEKRYKTFGCPFRRATLDYGDYSVNYQIDGNWRYNEAERISPDVVVERKMNLDELAGCFTHDRKRFEAEFQRAAEHGARIYLLVENASWEALRAHRYRSKFLPQAFEASFTTFMARYDMRLIMCKEETSGWLIAKILYRELKERLEHGIYKD